MMKENDEPDGGGSAVEQPTKPWAVSVQESHYLGAPATS